MRLFILPGVFRPHGDSWQLAHAAAAVGPGKDVLDLCSGSGVVGLSVAKAGARSVATVDVNRRARWTIRLNSAIRRLGVKAHFGDLYAPVAGQQFDLITANPPYLPDVGQERYPGFLGLAVEGGFDGRAVLDQIIAGAPRHLKPAGILMVVHSSVCGVEATETLMRSVGLEPDVISRQECPLNLLEGRVEDLWSAGLLPVGVRNDEVVVIQGRLMSSGS